MESIDTIGSELRRLRESRGLSLAETSRRADIGKSTLFQWEADLRVPRGVPLERLLDALETPERLRARLIAQADPRHARIVLAHRPLGSQVEIGQVLRAMRIRRGLTQAETARATGVSQGTFARWEGGGDVPDTATLHAAAFALDASPEEAAALTLARGGAGDVPSDPEEAVYFSIRVRWWEESLHEVLQLGIEADAWWRATHDPRWDVAVTSAMAKRAFRYFLDGRFEEADTTARRAILLARRPEARSEAVMALDVVECLARRRGDAPEAAIRLADAWAESIPEHDSPEGDSKVWATKIAARSRAAAGDLEGALRKAEPIRDLLALRANGELLAQRERFEFAGIFITGNVPERALPLLTPDAKTASLQTLNASILLANRESVPETSLEIMKSAASSVDAELQRAIQRVERKTAASAKASDVPLPYFT